MITFYNEDDEPRGTLELVEGKLVATGNAVDIVGPPEYREASDEALYQHYRAWSNGYSYSKEEGSEESKENPS